MADYTHRNLMQVEDAAPGLGLDTWQESRFAGADLEAARAGVAHHRIKPGTRQGFAHRHARAEEIYVVLAGSGRVKLDEDVVELRPLDAVRVAPSVLRSW